MSQQRIPPRDEAILRAAGRKSVAARTARARGRGPAGTHACRPGSGEAEHVRARRGRPPPGAGRSGEELRAWLEALEKLGGTPSGGQDRTAELRAILLELAGEAVRGEALADLVRLVQRIDNYAGRIRALD